MKRIYSFLLVIIMLVSFTMTLTACDKKSHKSSLEETVKKEPIEILKDYLKSNGNMYGYKNYGYSNDKYEFYEIEYDEKDDEITLSYVLLEDASESSLKSGYYPLSSIKRLATVYLDYKSNYSKTTWHYIFTDNTIYSGEANINKSVFSKSNDTLYDVDLTGLVSYSHYDITLSLFKSDVSSTFHYAEELFKKYNIDVSLSDLGYSNY